MHFDAYPEWPVDRHHATNPSGSSTLAKRNRSELIKWFAAEQNLSWGKYSLPDSASISKDKCWWKYSNARHEIVLLDIGGPGYGMVGGGLKYGEMSDIPPVAILNDAVLGRWGIATAGLAAGRGNVDNGVGIGGGFNRGGLSWEMTQASQFER
jgi:hypothetical protein